MKQIPLKLAAIAAAGLMMTACISSEDDAVTTQETVITSYAVSDIVTTLYTTSSTGADSAYTRTISGSDIYFNIDQVNNRIYSIDSLPQWVDLSRVVTSFTSYGTVYCRQRGQSDFFYFTSGEDSVDYTQKVEFLVVATDGVSTRHYTAELYKATSASDSLYWSDASAAGLQLAGRHRTLSLNDVLYVFAENGGSPTVSTLDAKTSGAVFTAPALLKGAAAAIDYRSITLFGGRFYALDANGALYAAQPEGGATAWTKVADTAFTQLLAADAYYLYATDGTAILASSDLKTWTENGNTSLQYLPQAGTATSVAYESRTNSALQQVVMTGLSAADGAQTAVWMKTAAQDAESNQTWSCIRHDVSDARALPYMADVQLLRFGGNLYALGGATPDAAAENAVSAADAYKYFYTSGDHGINWRRVTSGMRLPDGLREHDGAPVTAAVAGGHVWIVQSGGYVWRGTISSAQ
jgi:hypothetical protein